MIKALEGFINKNGFELLQFPQYSGVDLAMVKDKKIVSIAELKSKINLKYPDAMKRKGWIVEYAKIEKLQFLASMTKVTAYVMVYCEHFKELYIWKVTNANGDLNKEITLNVETIDMPKGTRKIMKPTKICRMQTLEAQIVKLD